MSIMKNEVFRIGSRKSALALAQTYQIIGRLKEVHPQITYEVVTMDTIGDKILDVALSKIGDKNLFTKELEGALIAKEVDFVVHSLKDLPTTLCSEFVLACICERFDKYDVAIFPAGSPSAQKLADLPAGSVIGTSAVRRVSQLQRRYPHLKFASVRGNLNTRLRKLDCENSEFAAIILAKAGLVRLDMFDRIGEELTEDGYAVGQGALACECRADDLRTRALLSSIHHEASALTSICERSFMRQLDGGCATPIGVISSLNADNLSLCGSVLSVDGKRKVEAEMTVVLPRTMKRRSVGMGMDGKRRRISESAPQKDFADEVFLGLVVHPICGPAVSRMEAAENLGKLLSDKVLEKGAGEILAEIRAQTKANPLAAPQH